MIRSVLRTLRVGKEKFYVGADLEGNSYYERPPVEAIDVGNWRMAKRTIVYAGKSRHLSEYGFETLPVQWSAWLRRTRLQPPTLEELQTDVQRQLSIQSNVQRLAIAYKEEKLRAIEPPIAESLAAALRNPAFVAREQEETLQQEAVMRKEEERRILEESGVTAVPVVEKIETEAKRPVEAVGEDTKPIPLGEDRARTQAILRRQLEKAELAAKPTGNPDSNYQPDSAAVKPRRR